MENKKSHWRYGVIAYGIKKKCRKHEMHIGGGSKGEIGHPVEEPQDFIAKELAKQWVADNMRITTKIIATARKWEFEENSPFESTSLLEPEWVKEWEITNA